MSLETRIDYIGVNYSPHDTDKDLSFYLHDILSEDADWDDEFWKFDLGRMQGFLEKLNMYFQKSPNGIKFSAIWSPDKIETSCEVTILELHNKLLNNQVGTKTEYVINKYT